MRILQINSVYNYGSTGRIVADIHHELIKRGHESFVIYGRKSAFGREGTVIHEEGVEFIGNKNEELQHLFFGVFFDNHGLCSKKITSKIVKRIQEIKPDIIQIHNLHGFYINYPMLFEAIQSMEIKVVWTFHDCWPFTGFCSHFEYNECDQWKTGCKKCPYRNVYPYRVFSRSSRNYELKKTLFGSVKSMHLVVPSNWMKERVKDSFLKDYPVQVIHNTIDLSRFKVLSDPETLRKENGLEKKQVILAVSGIWNKQKGLEEYKKLSSLLSEDQVLVMIGLTEKQINKMPEKIISLPRTESIEKLVEWYNIADVFVNLTLEDTYPTVNLEAQACGLPIITYRTGGSTEIAEKNGYVVEKYDLNKVMEWINTKPQKRIISDLEDRSMVDQYIELYQDIEKSSNCAAL